MLLSYKQIKVKWVEKDLGVAGADYLGVEELVSEANHEAAKGLVAVEAAVVGAHALERDLAGG